ncbi:hypothetical protein AVP41_01662 [Microbacterium sp. TNHR37B]|nr:hypothetical protein AVP41_01662 [Microbacterium sp. TNHR37B]
MWAAVGIVVVVAAGLFVHTQLPDTAATDIAGDALYAVVAYLAVVFIAPRLASRWAGLIAAGWCVAVELFQLTGLPLAWGAAFSPIMLVLGTVFDARDLVIYVVAVAVVAAGDRLLRARRRRRPGATD